MADKIIAFIKRPTNINIIINTIGNYLGVFFTALFALILVRILDPSQYGVLSVLLGIAYVLANILDFGTTATIYSFLPILLKEKQNEVTKFIKSIFVFQSSFALVIVIILCLTFPFLDKVFFKTQAPTWELYLTCISVLFLIWQNFVTNILFAAKKFLKANIYSNLSNVLKTILLFVLVYLKSVSVGLIIFIFGVIGPIIFFFFLLLEKKAYINLILNTKTDIKSVKFKYTFTFFIASQFSNLGLRMDLFLLSHFLIKQEVGYYGLAQKIILTIITTVASITQVLSPGFSHVKNKSDAAKNIKHGLLYMLIPSGLFVLLFLTPNFIFDLFFTTKFIKTAYLAKLLALPFIVYSIGSIPHLFVLYSVKKPIYNLFTNLLFFLVVTFGCYYFIPIYGVIAAPIMIATALITSTCF